MPEMPEMLIPPVHRSCCCNGASVVECSGASWSVLDRRGVFWIVVECLWGAGMADGMANSGLGG